MSAGAYYQGPDSSPEKHEYEAEALILQEQCSIE
jgi:hypothetical protein